MMNNEEFQKLVLKSLRWIMIRDTMKLEFRGLFDNTMTRKIDEALTPKESDSKKRVNKAVEESLCITCLKRPKVIGKQCNECYLDDIEDILKEKAVEEKR